MKHAAILLIALVLISFTLGCTTTQQEQETQEIQEEEVYSEIEETLLDEDSYVEIGRII